VLPAAPRARQIFEARAHQANAGRPAHIDLAKVLAEQELERVQRLAAANATTRRSLEQSQFDARMRADEHASAVFAVKVAAEEVRLTRVTLGQGNRPARDRHVDVLAPASGRVLRVFQKSAGVVPAGAQRR
jgi:FKBP-type peptidyl-prolyl cis-trans isomerase